MVRKNILATAVCGGLVLLSLNAPAFGLQFAARPTQETNRTKVSSRKSVTSPTRETAPIDEPNQIKRSIRKFPATLTPLKPMVVPAAIAREALDATTPTTASEPPQSVTPHISLRAKANAPLARFVKQPNHECDSTIDARPDSSTPCLKHNLK